jgi:DNA replication protein DnaC
MLTQPAIEKLCAMRLRGMADAFREQQEKADYQQLSFEERLGMLIDRQWHWRENRALDRRLRSGRLQGPACVEDIDFRTPRGLDRQLVRSLTQESVWVREHQNVFLIGPTGIGKTWLGRAFAQKACRDGYTALPRGTPQNQPLKVTSKPAISGRPGSLDLYRAEGISGNEKLTWR